MLKILKQSLKCEGNWCMHKLHCVIVSIGRGGGNVGKGASPGTKLTGRAMPSPALLQIQRTHLVFYTIKATGYFLLLLSCRCMCPAHLKSPTHYNIPWHISPELHPQNPSGRYVTKHSFKLRHMLTQGSLAVSSAIAPGCYLLTAALRALSAHSHHNTLLWSTSPALRFLHIPSSLLPFSLLLSLQSQFVSSWQQIVLLWVQKHPSPWKLIMLGGTFNMLYEAQPLLRSRTQPNQQVLQTSAQLTACPGDSQTTQSPSTKFSFHINSCVITKTW